MPNPKSILQSTDPDRSYHQQHMFHFPIVRFAAGSPDIIMSNRPETTSSTTTTTFNPRGDLATQRISHPEIQTRQVISRGAMSTDRPFVEAASSPIPAAGRRAPAAIASARLSQQKAPPRERYVVGNVSGRETTDDESDGEGEQQHNTRTVYTISPIPPAQFRNLRRRDVSPGEEQVMVDPQQDYSRTLHQTMSAQQVATAGAQLHPSIRGRRRSTSSTRNHEPLPNNFQQARGQMKSAATGRRPRKQSNASTKVAGDSSGGESRRNSRDYEETKPLPVAPYPTIRGPYATSQVSSTAPILSDAQRQYQQRLWTAPSPPSPGKNMPSPDIGFRETGWRPWVLFMQSPLKNHLVATLGEFVGTTMFLFFAFAGTQVASILTANLQDQTDGRDALSALLQLQKLIYIALSFGFSLMVNVWVFFRISGGLFNPAVTLALLLTKAIHPLRAPFLIGAQIAGGIAASALIIALFPTPLAVRTTLNTTLPKGLFIEAFLTAQLVFTILMLAKEKHKATFLAPVGIGLALFIAELVGVQFTGGSLNPARSFGPNVVTRTWDGTHWVYWVGPIIGAIIAVSFYFIIKGLEYEMANPGQDDDTHFRPVKALVHIHEEKKWRQHKQERSTHKASRYAGYHHDPVGRVSSDYHRGHAYKTSDDNRPQQPRWANEQRDPAEWV